MPGCWNFAPHSPEDRRRRTNGLVSLKARAFAPIMMTRQIGVFCTARLTDAESSAAAQLGGYLKSNWDNSWS